LYGIASQAGTNGAGTVFAVNIGGTGFSVLHTFTENSDGANPDAGLILSGNTLYGTASTGGSSSSGTVFRVNTDGTDFTNLHSFSSNSGYPGYTNSDGFEPLAGLILSGHILFGTTFNGGSSGSGTVFKVNTDGTDFTNLHSFTAVNSLTETGTNSDGAHPFASLILSGNALYGTASQGGKASAGAVFKINTDGTGFTNLHSFINKPNTANPAGGLILSGNTLYGTAAGGGGSTCGTLFSINTNGTDFTTLYSLTGPSGYDGGDPVAALILSDGTVYGTTMLDGTVNGNEAGNGTVFSFVLPVPVPVLLTLTPYGTSIILTWPVSETGFTLQSTTNLVPPVIWSTVSGQFTVTNSVSGMQKFYRLSQ
jgi:uncharacterized repeat protein (TIGR03803 family)